MWARHCNATMKPGILISTMLTKGELRKGLLLVGILVLHWTSRGESFGQLQLQHGTNGQQSESKENDPRKQELMRQTERMKAALTPDRLAKSSQDRRNAIEAIRKVIALEEEIAKGVEELFMHRYRYDLTSTLMIDGQWSEARRELKIWEERLKVHLAAPLGGIDRVRRTIKMCDEILKLPQEARESFTQSEQTIVSGRAHYEKRQMLDAANLYAHAIEIREKLLPAHPGANVRAYTELAHARMMLGDFPAAESFYLKAVELEQSTLGKDHPSGAEAYMHLVRMMERVRDVQGMLKYCQKVIDINRKNALTSSQDHLKCLIKVSNPLVLQNRLREAKINYTEALAISRKHQGELSPIFTVASHGLGKVHQLSSEFTIARRHFIAAEKGYPKMGAPFAVSHVDVIFCHSQCDHFLGDRLQAVEHAAEAVKMGDSMKPKPPKLAVYYMWYAEMLGTIGKWRESTVWHEKSVQHQRQQTRRDDEQLARVLTSQANHYAKIGDLNKARAAFDEANKLRDQKGLWSKQRVGGTLEFSNALTDAKHYYDVVRITEPAVEYCESSGKHFRSTAKFTKNLADSLSYLGQHERAIHYAEKSVVAAIKAFGEHSIAVAEWRFSAAQIYHRAGNLNQAKALLRKSLETRKQLAKDDGYSVPSCYCMLAHVLIDEGKYDDALRVADHLQKSLLPASLDKKSVKILEYLGHIYFRMGYVETSLALQQKLLEYYEKNDSHSEPINTYVRSNMGNSLKRLRRFADAEKLFLAARNRHEIGDYHSVQVTRLLVDLYTRNRDYERALRLARENIQSEELSKRHNPNTLGELYADQATILMNLYRFSEATDSFQAALEKFVQANRQGSRYHVVCTYNLAETLMQLGEFDQARKHLESAQQYFSLPRIRNTIYHTECLHNLARLAIHMNQYDEALKHLRAARAVEKAATIPNVLGCRTYSLLGHAHCFAGRIELADRAYTQAAKLVTNARICSSFQTPRQRMFSQEMVRDVVDDKFRVDLALNRPVEQLYHFAQTWKNVGSLQNNIVRVRPDQPQLKKLLEQLEISRNRLANYVFSRSEDRHSTTWRKKRAELLEHKEDLERSISQLVHSDDTLGATPVPLKTVQAAIPAGAVFLDYFGYIERTEELEWQVKYVVFAIKPDQKPKVIELGDEKTLRETIIAWRNAMGQGDGINQAKVASQLAQALWAPVRDYVGESSLVLISRDSALHFVPFSALPGKSRGSYLVEDHAIAYVDSVQQLMVAAKRQQNRTETREKNGPAPGGLLAIGGVDYGDREKTPELHVSVTNTVLRQKYEALPGTEREARNAIKSFSKSYPRSKTLLLKGNDAEEGRLRNELRADWDVIHVGTHGFSAQLSSPSGDRRQRRGAEQVEKFAAFHSTALLSSGIVLARKEDTDRNNGASHRYDGMLTAEEIMGIDMSETDLVVLAACHSGTGLESTFGGIHGIQQAFLSAGVQSTIASQWAVDDVYTAMLMEQFYKNLWEKHLPKHEALRQAQLHVLKQQENILQFAATRGIKLKPEPLPNAGRSEGRNHPRNWAGFEISGDWN